jgi:hypothetical protein
MRAGPNNRQISKTNRFIASKYNQELGQIQEANQRKRLDTWLDDGRFEFVVSNMSIQTPVRKMILD